MAEPLAPEPTLAGSITATTLIALAPPRVFALFSEHMHAWWRPEARFRFREKGGRGRLELTPRVGGEVFDLSEGERTVVGEVVRWSPPLGLAFKWRLTTPTLVEVSFAAEGGQTRVTLTHSGFGAVEVAFKNLLGVRWSEQLLALRRAAGAFDQGT